MVQPGPSSEVEAEQDAEAKGEAEGEAVLMEEDLIQQSLDDYDAGKYSPRLLGPNELPFDAHVLEAEEDTHRLLLLRQQLQVTGRSPTAALRPQAPPPAWLGVHACASGGRAGGGCCPPEQGLELTSRAGLAEGCPQAVKDAVAQTKAARWGSGRWRSPGGPRIGSFPAPSPTTKLFMGLLPTEKCRECFGCIFQHDSVGCTPRGQGAQRPGSGCTAPRAAPPAQRLLLPPSACPGLAGTAGPDVASPPCRRCHREHR